METVNRILQEKITARIAPNKAVLIFGARRVGKTVMILFFIEPSQIGEKVQYFTETYRIFMEFIGAERSLHKVLMKHTVHT